MEWEGDSSIVSNALRITAQGEVVLDRTLPLGIEPDTGVQTAAWILQFDVKMEDLLHLRTWIQAQWDPLSKQLLEKLDAVDLRCVASTNTTILELMGTGAAEPLYTTDCQGTKWHLSTKTGYSPGLVHVRICVDGQSRAADLNLSRAAWWHTGVGPARSPSGNESRILFENLSAFPIYIDNVSLVRHRFWEPEPWTHSCPQCVCSCRGKTYNRQQLMATWQNILNCPRIDGWTTPLHNHPKGACLTGGDSCFVWRPDSITGVCDQRPYCELRDNPATRSYMDMSFTCVNDVSLRPTAYLSFGSNPRAIALDSFATLSYWNCRPLILVYDFDIPGDTKEGCYPPPPADAWMLFASSPEGTYPNCSGTIRRQFRITITE